MLGEVVQVPSFLQLEAETQLPQWQRWVGYQAKISDDTFDYVSEGLEPAQLRRAGRWIKRKLKRGKAFEASKLKGLLVVSLDANEQFCSDHRCCEDCLTREITCKNADGQEIKHTQYYHKQVYAQLSGPELSVILDFEPMRSGEEECAAALRLLRRMRPAYGPRFFDLVVVDAWYANGPFLKVVVEELGWPVIAVLKQECREVYQEGLALTQGQAPTQVVERDRRQVENNAFDELTQHWHLTHCAHHHPVAVVALLWIKLIAFTLFHAFALLHGKRVRLGLATLNEVRKQLYRSLLCGEPIPFFSG